MAIHKANTNQAALVRINCSCLSPRHSVLFGQFSLSANVLQCQPQLIIENRLEYANKPSGSTLKYEPKLNIVLNQPEIPPNTGAVGRTCVALEAKLWLVRPLGFRVDEKTLRRAGLDYWQHLEWDVSDTWEDLIQSLGVGRMWFFSRFAEQPYTEVEYKIGDSLVFGSETSGLPPSILEANKERLLRIPTATMVRSINLSAAVAVAGFEAMRQINLDGG